MKIISWNVNGIRDIYKKRFLGWLKNSKADIICLQEIKADREQVPEKLLNPLGYHTCLNSAKRKGYAGVLVYTKGKPQKVKNQLGEKLFDQEGRILELRFPKFTICCLNNS